MRNFVYQDIWQFFVFFVGVQLCNFSNIYHATECGNVGNLYNEFSFLHAMTGRNVTYYIYIFDIFKKAWFWKVWKATKRYTKVYCNDCDERSLSRHRFCSVCGVQSFYRPRSNPDGVGVVPHCITRWALSLVQFTAELGTF